MPRFFSKAKDPVSSLTHFWGAIISTGGTLLLFARLVYTGGITSPQKVISVAVFGMSLIALYSASSIYHYVKASTPVMLRLRKLDHAMIYVLIAGTYTPILLTYLTGEKAVWMTSLIWLIGAVGVVLMLLWFSMPRWLSTLLYIGMGWFLVFDWEALLSMDRGAAILLGLGGACYTVGALLYALKKPNPKEGFGFHEIFHLFVIGGSVFHYFTVFFFVA